MKKPFSLLLCALLCVSCLGVPVFAETVTLSPQNLTVDGQTIDCEKYNIDGSNYFKLRDIAYLLNGTGSQFSVGWDGTTATVAIKTGEAYAADGSELVIGGDKSSTATISTQTITVDGSERSDLSVYNIGGNNYFKLRDLGMVLGFDVDYIESSNTATIASRSINGAVSDDSEIIQTAKGIVYKDYPSILSFENISQGISLNQTFVVDLPEYDVYARYYLYHIGDATAARNWAKTFSTWLQQNGYTLISEEVDSFDLDKNIIYKLTDPESRYTISVEPAYTYIENDAKLEVCIETYTKPGVLIFGVGGKINSVGGVEPSIYYRNISDKPIKYLTFEVTPYNAVNDKVYSSIGGYSTQLLRVTGPIEPFDITAFEDHYIWHRNPNAEQGGYYEVRCYSFENYQPYIGSGNYKHYLNEYEKSIVVCRATWDPVWYNSTVSYISIDSVKIEYMDGTVSNIKNPELGIWSYEPTAW